ncbi:MAG: hypothetical protein JWO38_85 [Gemmataceae bacterium]|nr:hypothetical protein [Gemmataceae bacterium]
MTEAEWLVFTRPNPMLRFLIGTEERVQDMTEFPACKGSDRKLRLFACACYYRIGHILPDSAAWTAVQVGERFADGMASWAELQAAEGRVRELSAELEPVWRASRGDERNALAPTHTALSLALVIAWREAQKAAYYASSNAYLGFASLTNPGVGPNDYGFGTSQAAEEAAQCGLLQDIFGNSFRPVTLSPSWLTPTVTTLARQMYDSRGFSPMPILADALQDAGCDHPDILAHCRGNGPHFRGCWVVDLVLGKE